MAVLNNVIFLRKLHQCIKFWHFVWMCVSGKQRDRDYEFSWASPVCLTRPSWWNRDEIPRAARSTQAYRPVLCLSVLQNSAVVVLLCKCHSYKNNTLYGWMTNCICFLHTRELMSCQATPNTNTSLHPYDERCLYSKYDNWCKGRRIQQFKKKKNLIRSILLRVNYKCGSDPETWKHEN